MGYQSKHFDLQELVGPEMFAKWGERCWEFLNVKLLITLDEVREFFGPVVINNWHDGGTYKESGLRDFLTATGAKMSQHKFGCAADSKVKGCAPQEVFDRIMAHPERFPMLTCMENVKATPTWNHFDVRNHQKDQQIWIVDPA